MAAINSHALVRVFVPTYRRARLLERALASLRAQTLTNWVCEVHNDDPSDPAPAQLIRHLNDPRIFLHQHERNLGARATFNLFYRPTSEPYYSLLEDDNWWEPQFLEIMHREMERHPAVTLGWCNQRIWEELPDGSWKDTGKFVSRPEKDESQLVEFGDPRQIMGAVHSHGSMLLRSGLGEIYETPSDWPLAAIEAFRERAMPHPLLYVSRPLAVFSRTLQTARNENRTEWGIAQTILAATFLKYCHRENGQFSKFVVNARDAWSLSVIPLFVSAFLERDCRNLLRHIRLLDWFLLFRGMVRRPAVFWHMFRCRRNHPDWWLALDRYTATRFAEKYA